MCEKIHKKPLIETTIIVRISGIYRSLTWVEAAVWRGIVVVVVECNTLMVTSDRALAESARIVRQYKVRRKEGQYCVV